MFSSRTPVAALPENSKQNMKIMSAITSTEDAPPLERIIINWRRFSMGLWRVPRGDIANAYSGSSFPKVTVFTHEGRFYTNGGCAFSKSIHAEVRGYSLIPADEYQGCESRPYSYEGRKATYKGKAFRLGTEIVFVASDPTVEEWRRLLRSLFADGGLFASGCTYPEFLTGRHAPDSGNGRTASTNELADCESGILPVIKDAMREWLDAGARPSRLPVQQLALSL